LAERRPTDRPAISRPVIITGRLVATPCIRAPTQKTTPPQITEPFRPRASTATLMMGGKAESAAPRPKIIVMRLSWPLVIGFPPKTSRSKVAMDLTPAM